MSAGAVLLPKLGTGTEGAGCEYAKTPADDDVEVLRELIAIAWRRDEP